VIAAPAHRGAGWKDTGQRHHPLPGVMIDAQGQKFVSTGKSGTSAAAPKATTSLSPSASMMRRKSSIAARSSISGTSAMAAVVAVSLQQHAEEQQRSSNRQINQPRPVHVRAIGRVHAVLPHIPPALPRQPVAHLKQAHIIVGVPPVIASAPGP
jgi:hypothetical protein